VVTSADILESIVGSFHTEEGPAEPAAVRRGDGSYLISGWMPAVEFAQLLDISLPASRQYQTFAGFLLQQVVASGRLLPTKACIRWRAPLSFMLWTMTSRFGPLSSDC
jgi:putative hemolysin